LLSQCDSSMLRGRLAIEEFENLASRVRNVTYPTQIEKNIVINTEQIPFYSYLQVGPYGNYEEKI